MPPGLIVQLFAGKLFNTTDPVATVQVGWLIVPSAGAVGTAFTINVQVAVAAAQGGPAGLFVVTVMVTVFPASAIAGVYVNENGDILTEAGLTKPAPFEVIVTVVALLNILPLTVFGVTPQVLPLVLLRESDGPLAHPQDTEKLVPVVVHPAAFLTVIVWLPLATLLNVVPV